MAHFQIADPQDLYLEEVHGAAAMNWVHRNNSATLPRLQSDARYSTVQSQLLRLYNSPDRLLNIEIRRGQVYNLWKDQNHVRGIYRRSSVESYFSGRPQWQTLIDLDQLAKEEKEDWIFSRSLMFKNRALIALSKGGKDAVVVREFDLEDRRFVSSNEFNLLNEGKHSFQWVDENTLIIGLGSAEDALTSSGYPRVLKKWTRGTSLTDATTIFSGDASDSFLYAQIYRDETDGPVREILLYQNLDFYKSNTFLYRNDQPRRLNVEDESFSNYERGMIYIQLKNEWQRLGKSYPSGSLVRISLENLLSENGEPEILFRSSREAILDSYVIVNERIFIGISKNVSVTWEELKKTEDGGWKTTPLGFPSHSNIRLEAQSNEDQILRFTSTGFLQPSTELTYSLRENSLKQTSTTPPRFDSDQLEAHQFFSISKDGTRIPYYVVSKKGMPLNEKNPAIIYAYGGFRHSLRPGYLSSMGKAWLEKGGVYVLANIRGGSEYGPEWHSAGLKENRQRVFDDLYSVAEDLISKKITSPEHLGIWGGSNGGLLTGVAMTQRPELFKAVVVEVPLLDMLRYHKLLAGASWMAEYGDPENPAMHEVLKKYSPYHSLSPGRVYPEPFFLTSTADDRVHPGHARRMAAKLEKMNLPYLYYENTVGGHGGASNNEQSATKTALILIYFMQKLGLN